MKLIEPGVRVKIIYLGKEKSPKGNTYKNFAVAVWEEEVKVLKSPTALAIGLISSYFSRFFSSSMVARKIRETKMTKPAISTSQISALEKLIIFADLPPRANSLPMPMNPEVEKSLSLVNKVRICH